MRIRQSPVVRKFQIAKSIGIVLMIEQVIQSQRERIIGRHIVNGIPCHARQGRDLRIRRLWSFGIVFPISQIFPGQCASDLVRSVGHRCDTIQSGGILYPSFRASRIIDLRIAVTEAKAVIPMVINHLVVCHFYTGISKIAFVNGILQLCRWILFRPADFIFEIHMIDGEFQTLAFTKIVFDSRFISPTFFWL